MLHFGCERGGRQRILIACLTQQFVLAVPFHQPTYLFFLLKKLWGSPDFSIPITLQGPVWKHGTVLGVLLFLGFATYSIGLQYTTASRSGFLLYLNVKFVPLFAYVLLGRHISKTAWAMAATALLGTFLLCNDGSPPNVGDLWSVLAAITSAFYILKLESSTEVCDAQTLNAVTMGVVAILSLCWTVGEASMANLTEGQGTQIVLVEGFAKLYGSWWQWCALLYLGIVCTAVSLF